MKGWWTDHSIETLLVLIEYGSTHQPQKCSFFSLYILTLSIWAPICSRKYESYNNRQQINEFWCWLVAAKLSRYSTLKHGDTVSSIQKCPRGAYTITLPASSLFVLPRKLDMGEAAASKWSRKMKLWTRLKSDTLSSSFYVSSGL